MGFTLAMTDYRQFKAIIGFQILIEQISFFLQTKIIEQFSTDEQRGLVGMPPISEEQIAKDKAITEGVPVEQLNTNKENGNADIA